MDRLRRLGFPRWLALGLLAFLSLLLVVLMPGAAVAQDTILQISGQLTEADAQFADGNRPYDTYTFEGKAGQPVLISLASVNFNSYLILLDPDGQPVAENNDISPFTRHAQLLERLPRSGGYTVYATAKSGLGTYALTILALSDPVYSLQQQALALQIEGETAFLQSDYAAAIRPLETALGLYRQAQHPPSIAATLNILARVNLVMGRVDQVLPAYEEALDIYQQLQREGDAVSVLNNMGSFFYSQSEYGSALATYEKALALARKQQDVDSEASLLGHMGLVLTDLGRFPDALTLLEQALDLQMAVDDVAGTGAVLNNLGRIYNALGQTDQSLDYLQRSLVLARQQDDRSGIAITLTNLGAVHQSRQEYDRAIDYHRQALAILQAIEEPFGQALALNNLGTAYDQLGQLNRALDLFRQSLQLFEALGNQSAMGRNLSNMGRIYGQLGQAQQAEDHYQRALSQVQTVGDRYGEALILEHLAELRWQFDRYEDAETLVRQAVTILEQLRHQDLSDTNKVAIFELQQKTYQALQYILIKQDRVDAALIAAEQGRARAFAEGIAQNSNLSLPPGEDSLDIPGIQQLAGQATIVEYAVLDQLDVADAYYAWVIAPTGDITLRSLPVSGDAVAAAIDSQRLGFFSRGERGPTGLAGLATQTDFRSIVAGEQSYRTLHQQLIEPILDLLPTDPMATVVFVPQGNLFFVPFPALKSAQGEFLVAQHTLQTAPSITVLKLAQQLQTQVNTSAAQDVLVVGNPVMPTVWQSGEVVALPNLPGAQLEAESVATVLNAEPLLGVRATEAQVKQRAATARVIHLATHGLLDYGDPTSLGVRDTPGAIALTPSANEDGLLTSAEILKLDLSAELVVLSACDTGRGAITSDGVVGLSRSLITAGVPNVVVSLWAVPDASTAELMTIFYQQLHQGLAKAQALRQAMLQVQADYPNPRDWAAFTLIGPTQNSPVVGANSPHLGED